MYNGASSYRRFIDGDDSGFVEIIKIYKNGLIFFLNGYVNNINIAEDLAEDTFFKLVIKKPKFNGDASFKTWLYTIGRNIALNELKRKSKFPNVPLEYCEGFLCDDKDFDQTYLIEERKIVIHRVLGKLNPLYREVLTLIYFEEMSCNEVAKIMKKSNRQISNISYRAKESLKFELNKEGFIYEEL